MPVQTAVKTYLNFVPFSQIVNWSVNSLLDTNFGYSDNYKFAKIGEFLKRAKNEISIANGVEYKRVTVRINNKGVLLRDTEKGENIGTKKQFIAKAGQFIVSKIDARNGAFGIIPTDLDGAIVTNDFPLFNIDTSRINPYFLVFITTTKEFIKFAQSCSSGTTNRQRMDIALFLNQKIPLPTLAEQEKLVNDYYQKIAQVEVLEKEAKDLEVEIERYFYNELGLKKENDKLKFGKLRFIDYANLERWDGKNESDLISKYGITKLGKLIVNIGTGTTPPTGRKEYFKDEVNFYTPSDIGVSMLLNHSERRISDLAIKDKKARKFEKDTLLFVGIGSTVGKIGIVNNEYATSNQQITGFRVNENILLKEYVYYFFNLCKEITIKEQTKATLPIVNQEKILNIPIPLPPLQKQRDIIDKIDSLKNRITTQKAAAEALKAAAKKEFETTLFG